MKNSAFHCIAKNVFKNVFKTENKATFKLITYISRFRKQLCTLRSIGRAIKKIIPLRQ